MTKSEELVTIGDCNICFAGEGDEESVVVDCGGRSIEIQQLLSSCNRFYDMSSSSFSSLTTSSSIANLVFSSRNQFLSVKKQSQSIRCARVGGVEIPVNKRIEYSLQYIHGIC